MYDYFSADYLAARQKFLASADKSDAAVESYRNRDAEIDDVQLYTDVARIGDPSAENVLVLISGTHGVEGFAGSAIQSGLLVEGVSDMLGSETALVLIHALNPYGFAHLRRTNEDNVDLNRNFIDFTSVLPVNHDYSQLAGSIAPRRLSTMSNIMASARILLYRLRKGEGALQRAVSSGQYAFPQGLFYGGQKPSWSNQTLTNIIQRTLSAAQRIICVDFHTGLGPYGFGELIMFESQDSAVYQRASQWWGEGRVKSAVSGGSVSSPLNGTIKQAFVNMIPRADVTAVGLEFGTLPLMRVFRALRVENWFHHNSDVLDSKTQQAKHQLLRAFCPDDAEWRLKVLGQARQVVGKAISVLNG